MGTTDRKFSREICIANLTCPFISTLSLHYVWPTHQPSRAASSVTDLKVSQTTRHTFPVSNLPCAYLSCYLLTYYQPNGGSRALVVNDKSKNVFFRGRKEVLMNVNGTLDFSINSATTRIIYIYIYMNAVPFWIPNEKNYEEISANAQFLFMTDGEREDHCYNSRWKCFWEDTFFFSNKNVEKRHSRIRDSTKLLKMNNFSSFWPFAQHFSKH